MAFDNPDQVERANRAEVRNPVLALPAFKALQALTPDLRRQLAALLYDLAAQARDKAAAELKRNKPWMFVYWRCIGVYARHTARALMSAHNGGPALDGEAAYG